MKGCILTTKANAYLVLWIELNPERFRVFDGKALAQTPNSSRNGVAMIRRFCHRLKQPIENKARWRQIGVHH
jgi:hypothetical protein